MHAAPAGDVSRGRVQESGPPYAPDVPEGVNPDGARLLHKFRRQQERLPSDRRLSVGIAYSYAPNADAPGETLANEAVDPSQLTADDRAFLDEAIHDYNVQFGTAYETNAQGFEGYYKDISRQPAERTIDFDDVDVNSTKLGRTVAQRNDKLTRHKVVGNLPSSRPVTSQAPRSPTLFLHRSLHAEPGVSSSSECFAADMVSSHVYSWEENLPKSERNARHSAHAGSDVSGAAQAAAPEWTPPRRGVRGRGPSASSP